MGRPLSIASCKPTMNNKIKNFRIRIFNSLHQELSKNFVQEHTTTTATPIITSTTENYRHFRGGFQYGHLRRK